MKNFRPIRTAVTLSMIVAMMIQPMVATAIGASCGQKDCVESLMCQGCGCCEVAKADERCCCCSRPDETPAESQESDADSREETSVGGVCLCGLTVPPMDRGSERNADRIEVRQVEFLPLVLPKDDDRSLRDRQWVTTSESILNPRFSQRFLCVWRL